MQPIIKVMLVDDDPNTLAFLEAWLTDNCDLPYRFQILGKALSGNEAIQQLKNVQPDLMILDLNMPETSGMIVARFAKTLSPTPRILLYSGYDDLLEWQDTVHEHIRGYVIKNSPVEKLEMAVEKILAGDLFWDPLVYYHMHQKSHEPRKPLVWKEELTDREQDIFALFCKGHTPTQMANQLNLSINTIKTHLKNICQKANCADIAKLRQLVF
ncbi:MAG: response regulator transcription factor [Candidatus Sericytochromatia bacterium]|nr:response regulator transcription factor [Candidatus Sericytochromatia bacterium]MBT9549036.1 response regulator transcription factor [Candidatus Sericytochromatia bacterium]